MESWRKLVLLVKAFAASDAESSPVAHAPTEAAAEAQNVTVWKSIDQLS